MPDTIEISVEKCRVGPITKRYRADTGEFEPVETVTEGCVRRVAICGLDGSHSGDYKVAYASDPLLVVTTSEPDMTHDRLERFLREQGMWLDGFQSIDIPTVDGWKPGFKSLPEASERIGLFRARAEALIEREMDIRGGENGFAAHIPV